MDEIVCILCTYNGEKYIYDQLESIFQQTIRINRLIICDDASIDNTVKIIKKWQKNVDFPVSIYENDYSIGCIRNFEKALSLATSEYIFLADQDDVWLPNKVEITMKELKCLEDLYGKDTPCLVHSDLIVVDKDLQVLHKSFLKNQGINHVFDEKKQLQCLMVQNFVTGCTIAINRALKDKAMPFPKNIVMHDHWLALVASLTGKIGFVDKPTIFYRQHGRNTVGAVKYMSLTNIINAFSTREMLSRVAAIIGQLRTVHNYKNGELVINDNYITTFLHNIDGRDYVKILLSDVRKQGILCNIAFKYYLICYILKKRFSK